MLTVTLNFSPFVTLLLLCIFVEVVFLIVILLSRINWSIPVAPMAAELLIPQGNKVQATAFKNDIEGIDQRLELYSTYLISNAYVKIAYDPHLCPDPNYHYAWSFTRRTLIQDAPLEDEINFRQLAETGAKSFDDFFNAYLNSERFKVLAVVICRLPREFIVTEKGQQPAMDFVVVDESCMPIVLTLWEDFARTQGPEIEAQLHQGRYPLVLINRVAITLYQGLSLSTRFGTHIEVNPTGPRAALLKAWLHENLKEVDMMLEGKTYNNLNAFAKPLVQARTSISSLSDVLNQSQIAWVMGTISLADPTEAGYYIGCDYCNRKVNCNEGMKFQCMYCGQKNGTTVKRFRVAATITDDTGFVDVTLFTNDVLEIVKHASLEPSGELELAALNEGIANLSFVLGIRRTKQDDEGLQRNAYGIVCLCKVPTPLVDSPDDFLGDNPDGSHQQTKRKLDFLQPTANVLPSETGSPSTHAALPMRQLKSKKQKDSATIPLQGKMAQDTTPKITTLPTSPSSP